MKICHLSVGDPFTARWANSQAHDGHEVHLIMLTPPTERLEGVITHMLPFQPPLGYYLNRFPLKRLLHHIDPDLLHVHYAAGNGTLGRLSGFHPCILSIWGSDVMVTPYKSAFLRKMVIKNLRHYDRLCSTSQIMAESIKSLCGTLPPIILTPIGVDTSIFSPAPKSDDGIITIGTVKSLNRIYGIDTLFMAFVEMRKTLDTRGNTVRLLIVGDGPQKRELTELSLKLGMTDAVEFAGAVPNYRVPEFLRRMDIFCTLSRLESFGVSVVEASACGLPVLVSNVGGLPEVAKNGQTGFIVPPDNVAAAANALRELVSDASLRQQFGAKGREFIRKTYEWEKCLKIMYGVYDEVVDKSIGRTGA